MAGDCREVVERIAKLEVRADNSDARMDTHQQLLFKLDEDIKEMREHLSRKIEQSHEVALKAMDTVPPWAAKLAITISVMIAAAAFGLHHYHVF